MCNFLDMWGLEVEKRRGEWDIQSLHPVLECSDIEERVTSAKDDPACFTGYNNKV